MVSQRLVDPYPRWNGKRPKMGRCMMCVLCKTLMLFLWPVCFQGYFLSQISLSVRLSHQSILQLSSYVYTYIYIYIYIYIYVLSGMDS